MSEPREDLPKEDEVLPSLFPHEITPAEEEELEEAVLDEPDLVL